LTILIFSEIENIMKNSTQLKSELEAVYHKLNKKDYLSSDPVEYVHSHKDPWDQEAFALLASQLAYGNAKLIRKALDSLTQSFNKLNDSPSSFTRSLGHSKNRQKIMLIFKDFYYRFHKGEDIVHLLTLLNKSWSLHGSLAAHFHKYFLESNSLEFSLGSVLKDWKKWHKNPTRAFNHFLSSPKDKSACKRWCLFLKWMIRKDEIDLGTWQNPQLYSLNPHSHASVFISPKDLIIPVDTHILKISQKLKLTQEKNASWKTALEITEKLKEFDPLDPIKYDFSISRIGIMKLNNKDYFSS